MYDYDNDVQKESWDFIRKTKTAKRNTVIVNGSAMIILLTKYSWPVIAQAIGTPLIIGTAIIYTGLQAIKWDQQKRKIQKLMNHEK